MLPQLRHAHILSALAAQGAVQVSVDLEKTAPFSVRLVERH